MRPNVAGIIQRRTNQIKRCQRNLQMSQTTVILINYSDGITKQAKIRAGVLSPKEKQDFLTKVSEYESFDNVCSFNVHYDKKLMHVPAKGGTRQFIPMHSQNKKNELIIEIIPNLNKNECWANNETSCIKCLQTGGCQSYPIKNLIGIKFFKDNYTDQK